MQVQLLTHTPDPELVVAAAARLCYSDAGISELLNKDRDQQLKLLQKILGLGHLSVLEHASFSFGIEGISRACSHQLVRHRLASYSQQSQRYVSAEERFEAVNPPSIAQQPDLLKTYEDFLASAGRVYAEMLEAGIPAEDARFVLPNAATTKIVVTMNGRELQHFFSLRCCRRAQWEIQEMARQMLRLARQAAPALFSTSGPGCLRGTCPEGAMSCGEPEAVRTEFARI